MKLLMCAENHSTTKLVVAAVVGMVVVGAVIAVVAVVVTVTTVVVVSRHVWGCIRSNRLQKASSWPRCSSNLSTKMSLCTLSTMKWSSNIALWLWLSGMHALLEGDCMSGKGLNM